VLCFNNYAYLSTLSFEVHEYGMYTKIMSSFSLVSKAFYAHVVPGVGSTPACRLMVIGALDIDFYEIRGWVRDRSQAF
jgi:hypothetical protein